MRELRVTITEDDIKAGFAASRRAIRRGDDHCRCCGLAQTLARLMPGEAVEVDIDGVTFLSRKSEKDPLGRGRLVLLPSEAQDFVSEFDLALKGHASLDDLKPLTFVWTIPFDVEVRP